MNIVRLYDKKTKKFIYKNKVSKKLIKNKDTLNRINSLRIPPAYFNVAISSDKKSKIQAIGTDLKKRKQYIYNKDYIENQKKLKFTDLILFGKKIKRIRHDINNNITKCSKNLNLTNNKECVISVILYLIDRCNFRVGCEKYKDLYNTYGVTTLNNSHIKFNKNNLVIEFIGKKGVLNKNKVNNTNVCSILKKLCESRKKYIFNYKDLKNNEYRINEKHINDWLKKYNKNITVKMFRTWNANYILLREILNMELPDSEKLAKKNISKAIKKAAAQLHHTANVSKKSYIDNEIVNLYISNPIKFKNLVEKYRKPNGNLPSISRLLNLIIQSF